MSVILCFVRTSTLVKLILLNCVGTGVLLQPPRLFPFGISAMLAWILTGIGTLSIGLLFAYLAKIYSTSVLHMLIGKPFEKYGLSYGISGGMFWGYFIFCVSGNALFGMKTVEGVSKLFPQLINATTPLLFILYLIIYLLSRYPDKIGKLVSQVLLVLKLAIVGILPVLTIFLAKKLSFDWVSTSVSSEPLLKSMFLTVWAFLGIESVSTMPGIKGRTMRDGMVIGSLICILIYLINTGIFFSVIGGTGRNTVNIFDVIFPSHSTLIGNIVNIIMFVGTLYGWTFASVSMFADGAGIVPKFLLKQNKYSIYEPALALSSVAAFSMSLLGVVRSELLMDVGTSLCLVVYLGAIVATGIHIWLHNRKVKYILLWLISAAYIIFAFAGAPFVANVIAFITILVTMALYAFI